MVEETQEIIDKKPSNQVETEEENGYIVGVLNLLVPGGLQKKSWMRW